MNKTFGIALLSLICLMAGCTGGPQLGPSVVDEDAPEQFSTTASGLRFRIRRRGNGKTPAVSSKVRVHYRGWLDDGTEFDSSYDGDPIEFPLSRVVAGWTEGLQLVSEGGMIELEVPSHLGYGARGAGSKVPPNATLHFLVELIAVR